MSSLNGCRGVVEFTKEEIALAFQVAKEFPTFSRSARRSIEGVERFASTPVRDLIRKLDAADDVAREREGSSVEVILTLEELALLTEGGNLVLRWLGEIEFRTRTGFDAADAAALLNSLEAAL